MSGTSLDSYTSSPSPASSMVECCRDSEEAYSVAGLASLYASAAAVAGLAGESMYDEFMQRYYDAMSLLVSHIDAGYIEGAAMAAASKKHDVTVLIDMYGEDYLATLLSYLASPACDTGLVAEIAREIIGVLGVDEWAANWLQGRLEGCSCQEAKYLVALLLATPPRGG